MDFPSASTFGLIPSRRTAIALPIEIVDDLSAETELELELLEDDDLDEVGFEIVFEPWDDELDDYVICGFEEEDEEEDEDDEDRDDGFVC